MENPRPSSLQSAGTGRLLTRIAWDANEDFTRMPNQKDQLLTQLIWVASPRCYSQAINRQRPPVF